MNRNGVRSTIVLLAAVGFASMAFAGTAEIGTHGATPQPAVPNERVYEIPPGSRITPIVFGHYCNEDDCTADRSRRCSDRGHGEATESVFNISAEGSGSCLITCDDGYMLLIVEDQCTEGSATSGVRQRQIWIAPAGRPCVNAHALGTDAAICVAAPAVTIQTTPTTGDVARR